MHIEIGDKTAKFWVDPVEISYSRGFPSRELTHLRAIVIERRLEILEAWHGHFGGSTQL